MAKRCFIIICALFSIISANNTEPRDLVEEVYQQLFELQNIVYGEIFVGRDRLQHLQREFGDGAQKVAQKTSLDLQQEHETKNTHLITMADLAQSTGKDVSSCTNGHEDFFNNLLADYNQNVGSCIDQIIESVVAAVSDSRYLIDIFVTKVHHFEYQLNQCGESLECISPLLTQILEERVLIPQRVREEVQNCSDIASELELSVQICADQNVAEYIFEANAILEEITDCVNGIIG